MLSYLTDLRMSQNIDISELLLPNYQTRRNNSDSGSGIDINALSSMISERIISQLNIPSNLLVNQQCVVPPPLAVTSPVPNRTFAQPLQTNLQSFATIRKKKLPSPKSAEHMWKHWFNGAADERLYQPLKDYNTATLSKGEKSTYNERANVGKEMEKYGSYTEFEVAYAGFTRTYTMIPDEIRRRKKSGLI